MKTPAHNRPAGWASDCCDAPPVGRVTEYYELKTDKEHRCIGKCEKCGEPCEFHEA